MQTETHPTFSSLKVVRAEEIVVGDAIPESDGYMLAVLKIERKGSTIVFTLANDFSPIKAWRSDGEGLTLRKRASTRMYVARAAGKDVVPSLAEVAS